jgi:hypothetical protein
MLMLTAMLADRLGLEPWAFVLAAVDDPVL